MHSGQLELAQIRKIRQRVKYEVAYLSALAGRMCQKWFPIDDPLKEKAEEALRAALDLEKVLARLESEKSVV